jgi:hypothetical protein
VAGNRKTKPATSQWLDEQYRAQRIALGTGGGRRGAKHSRRSWCPARKAGVHGRRAGYSPLVNASHGQAANRPDGRGRRTPTWVNWVLALLTVPAAGMVLLFALGGVMKTAGCSDQPCRQGPDDFWFGILLYGAPVVAVLAIAISFYTARRKRGIWVPVCGLAFLVADVTVLAVSFRQ